MLDPGVDFHLKYQRLKVWRRNYIYPNKSQHVKKFRGEKRSSTAKKVSGMEDSLHAIFHQILDIPGIRAATPPEGLLEFLSKIPSYLESCPNIILSLNEEDPGVILERRQFLFWFLRRLSCFPRSPPFERHCLSIQTSLLSLVLSRQPQLFTDLIQEYVTNLEGNFAQTSLVL